VRPTPGCRLLGVIVSEESLTPYFVTVERRGVSPLRVQLLVRGTSKRAAAEVACGIAELQRGGMFEPKRIRRAAREVTAFHPWSYDDAGR
jgi:hypothetical protein